MSYEQAKQAVKKITTRSKPVNGLHVKYSQVNAAYLLMWFDAILSYHNDLVSARSEASLLLATIN